MPKKPVKILPLDREDTQERVDIQSPLEIPGNLCASPWFLQILKCMILIVTVAGLYFRRSRTLAVHGAADVDVVLEEGKEGKTRKEGQEEEEDGQQQQ